jgi:1,4-dihydroxy-2-naphthoate octaprenyltransferase
MALQIGVNFANDYSDGIRGADAKRVGPRRLVASGDASPAAVRAAALAAFAVAAAAGAALAGLSGHWWLIGVGAAAILAAWFYTGGPRPYGYAGFGEAGVFVFFGPVAVLGTAYTQHPRLSLAAVAGSFGIGLLACAILMANNLRDIPSDRKAGKLTLAVRLGDRRARRVYTGEIAAAFLAVAPCALAEPRAWVTLLMAVPAIRAVGAVARGARGEALVAVLRGTGRIELGYGLLLGLALGVRMGLGAASGPLG